MTCPAEIKKPFFKLCSRGEPREQTAGVESSMVPVVLEPARSSRYILIGGIIGSLLAACSDPSDSAALGSDASAAEASDAKTDTSPPATACSGKPGALRGKSNQTLSVAGLSRTFLYYAPSSLSADTPAPLVFIPHGYTMTADMMFDITKYAEIAEREKFIAVFPNGQPGAFGPWNVGAPDCSSSLGILPTASGDDQAFVSAVLDFAEADQCLDRNHVFMTGFSMGGYLSNETGCLRPEVRAVAPHSGGTHDLSTCVTQRKPVLVMHFNGDGLIPYQCGQQARDRWVARNGCQLDQPEVKMVTGGTCEYYKGCPADGQVAFCSFNIPTTGTRDESFPGHAWSGGSKQGAGAAFAIPETESASALSWAFFKKYAW